MYSHLSTLSGMDRANKQKATSKRILIEKGRKSIFDDNV